jgi:hypothetical protein
MRNLLRCFLALVLCCLCSGYLNAQSITADFNTSPAAACSLPSGCTSFTTNVSGAVFVFTLVSTDAGGSMQFLAANGGVGSSGSMDVQSGTAPNLNTTEKVIIVRQDGGDFNFNSIYIQNNLAATTTVQGYKDMALVGSAQTVALGATSTLGFSGISVDMVELSSTDFFYITFDNFSACAAPAPSFTVNTVCAGSPTSFTDASTLVATEATYAWDFENDNTTDNTTKGNVSHTYITAGPFTAKLTITQGGCSNSFTRQVSFLETSAASVTSVTVPANGTYKAGDNLNFTVNFNQNVLVTGTPQIALTIGAAVRNAQYLSGSGTGALVFRYTVQAGDLDANGISVGALSLNGGTINTSCNAAASLTLNSVGATSGVLVDAVVPTVTINQASTQADPTGNTTIHFTAIFNEAVSGFTNGDVTLGGTALAMTVVVTEIAPNNGTIYNVAVSGMTVDGTVTASIAANKASDAAGNLNTASTSTDNTVTYVADAPPSVLSSNRRTPSVALTNATTVTFRVTFSESVIGVDATDFNLTATGGVAGTIGTVTGSGITWDVQVSSITGDGTLRLDVKSTGTGIKDGVGQDLTGGFTGGQAYTIDQTAPVVDDCPENITQPAGSNCTATATWSAPTATDNVDGSLTHSNSSHDPGATFSGTTTVSYSFHDQAGNETICSFQVIVQDNTAPGFTVGLSATPVTIWPPDHKLKTIALTYTTADNCPGTVTNRITVTSSDPISGVSDGDKFPDWIVLNDHSLQLRAERGNGKEARVYTITVTPVDVAGNEGTPQTVEVRIAHNITAPVSGTSFKIGSTVSFAGVFWDKPGNRHTANWLIDGSTVVKGVVTEPSGLKNGKVTGAYKFGAAGVYKLQMNIIDQNKVTSYVNTNEDLEAIVVIYDPNGGYAYGGGTFASPAGALTANPAATGKVSYGFTVNYFKGATLPKGETQFELKVGDFEFNALNFDYLSIAGARAQFKGSGRIIGGQSGINFIMTVIDGQLDGSGEDKVRIKIFNKNTGQVYYDNEPGISEADNPATKVTPGSQVVISGTPVQTGAAVTRVESRTEATDLQLKVLPNPTQDAFQVFVQSDNKQDKIILDVFDLYGRRVERRLLTGEHTLGLGAHYSPGTYLIRIVQGNKQRDAKLLKLPD